LKKKVTFKFMKKINFKIVIYTLFWAGVFLAGMSTGILVTQKNSNQPIVYLESSEKPVSIMVDEGDGVIKVITDINWVKGMTVFDALKIASEKQNFNLEYKDYGDDLGVFIESIDDKKGSDNTWWQYWINNKYGEIGSSSAKINAGDAIMWKLSKGQMN